MPIYEYRCQRCRRVSSLLVRSFSASVEPVCSHCGNTTLDRLISRFAFHRSEEDRLEQLADPSTFGGFDESDPKSIARWAKKMGQEMGEDLGPEFDEAIEQMEAGEMPDDLGEGGGDYDDGPGFGGGMGGPGFGGGGFDDSEF